MEVNRLPWTLFKIYACTKVARLFYRFICEQEKRYFYDELRRCSLGCVNIGYSTKIDNETIKRFIGSGFFLGNKQLEDALRNKFEPNGKSTEALKYHWDWFIVTNYHVCKEVVDHAKKFKSDLTIENFEYGGDEQIMINPGHYENSRQTQQNESDECVYESEPLRVIFNSDDNRERFLSARVVNYCKSKDLAILVPVTQKGVPDISFYVPMVQNELAYHEPKLLDTVYAFGCPEGFTSSVTKGNVKLLSKG